MREDTTSTGETPWRLFGSTLQSAIEAAGQSPVQLARALGTPPSTLTELASGQREPLDEMQVRLMDQALAAQGR